MNGVDNAAMRVYVAARDGLLRALVTSLRSDDRIIAAWLGGSFGHDQEDALSDLDVQVVVSDAAGALLCVRPWQRAARTTEARLALFSCCAEPAIIFENNGNAPVSGTSTCVIYTCAIVVDWLLLPYTGASRPPDSRLLFDKAGIPLAESPVLAPREKRVERASERVAYFWMMAAITAKYIVRGDVVYAHHLLVALNDCVREVRELVTGTPPGYRRGSLIGAEAGLDDPESAVRELCRRMLALASEVVALGGVVPAEPLPIVNAILSLAADRH